MQGSSEINLSPPRIHVEGDPKESVGSSTSTDLVITNMATMPSTHARSVAVTTLPSHVHGHVCVFSTAGSASEPRRRPPPLSLIYPDLTIHVHSRPATVSLSPQDIEIFERVTHPYNYRAFQQLLSKHDLLNFYPRLIVNLQRGFPLGTLPLLTDSVLIKNHSSVDEYPEVIRAYLSDEIAACRMSGPFSLSHTERILRGPVFSSPLIVAVQQQGPDLPPKYRVCRNLSKDDPLTGVFSVNSFIDKEDFPTRFDIAYLVAEQVNLAFY